MCIRDREKKGTKLYCVPFIPFLYWLFRQQVLSTVVPGAVGKAAVAAGMAAAGKAGAASGGAAGVASGSGVGVSVVSEVKPGRVLLTLKYGVLAGTSFTTLGFLACVFFPRGIDVYKRQASSLDSPYTFTGRHLSDSVFRPALLPSST